MSEKMAGQHDGATRRESCLHYVIGDAGLETSPDCGLVTVDSDSGTNIESRLRAALQGHFSVVDVSGGQTLLTLWGPAVHLVLKKCSVYDFHPSRFLVGRCVQTTFAKASALISKTADDSFDLVIRHSFSDYLFRWLIDAASEYGVGINNETGRSRGKQ